jgi:hypothetical protein
MRRPWPTGGCRAKDKQNKQTNKYCKCLLVHIVIPTKRLTDPRSIYPRHKSATRAGKRHGSIKRGRRTQRWQTSILLAATQDISHIHHSQDTSHTYTSHTYTSHVHITQGHITNTHHTQDTLYTGHITHTHYKQDTSHTYISHTGHITHRTHHNIHITHRTHHSQDTSHTYRVSPLCV